MSKNWNKNSDNFEENARLDRFLSELFSLYRKHGVSISHEDNHGVFIIEEYSCDNIDWMNDCSFSFSENPA